MSRPMSRWLKLLIGLLAALLVAWLSHGPLGRGAAYADLLQQRADFVLRISEVPNLQARIGRAPLSRTVFLCGPTNDFQRNGTLAWRGGGADFPGLDGRMLQVGGISGVVWDPAPPSPEASTPPCRPGGPGTAGGGLPLLIQLMILGALVYGLGIGIGWLLFRPRRKRTSYLS